MRIEKRGNTEYLIGDGAGCRAGSVHGLCTAHFDGHHLAVGIDMGAGRPVYHRWPIEQPSPAAASASPLRPAEEIAREMIVRVDEEERFCWFALLKYGDDRRALACMNEEDTYKAAHDDAVGWLTRLIEQSRAEGAKAERATRPAASMGYDVQQALALVGCDRALSDIEDAIALAYEEGQRAARVTVYPTQPSDLAGRIRALVQEYAGRWADNINRDESNALSRAMGLLRRAIRAARDGESVWPFIARMRAGQERWNSYGIIVLKAADELEAVVQACSTEARR
jgi:hypothetical protein